MMEWLGLGNDNLGSSLKFDYVNNHYYYEIIINNNIIIIMKLELGK